MSTQSACPYTHKLRPELPPLTKRIAALPVDDRGYPVPFFVALIDGKPDFRMARPEAMRDCIQKRLCWTCGQPLGRFMAFPIGPMCALNRTTAEPPSHRDCAEWSVKGCPFLSRPNMTRREDEMTEAAAGNVAGVMIRRNPGAIAIWITNEYRRFSDGRGGMLIRIGRPLEVTWWREGRPAARAEVLESINTGMPLLRTQCELEPPEEQAAAHAELGRLYERALSLLPAK